MNQNSGYAVPRWVMASGAVAVAVGVAGTAATFVISPRAGWTWLIVGFVTATGIANAMLAWAGALRVAQARWAASVNRLCHAALAFVPVAAVALAALLLGVRDYVPWAEHPVPGKEAWLNVPFMVTRDAVALGVFWALCFAMVRWGLEADSKTARGEQISPNEHYRLNAVAAAVVVVFTVAATIVSYDLIMSLTPEWISTMFGAYYFCTSLYAALGLVAIMGALARANPTAARYLTPQQFHDIGNLMLAFSLFDMGLFFAQYLTIWYENLPEETGFLLVRYANEPWPVLGWTAFVVAFALPFVLLQSRRLKKNATLLAIVGGLAIVGVALDRYVLVAPSLAPHHLLATPLGASAVLAFAGAGVVAASVFLNRYPVVSSADEALREANPGEAVG